MRLFDESRQGGGQFEGSGLSENLVSRYDWASCDAGLRVLPVELPVSACERSPERL